MWETWPGTSQQVVVSNLLWEYASAYVFCSIWRYPPWTASSHWPALPAIAVEYHQERQADLPMRDWQPCAHPPFAVLANKGTTPAMYPHGIAHASNPIGKSCTWSAWFQFFGRPRMCWYASQSIAGPVLFTSHRGIVPRRWTAANN